MRFKSLYSIFATTTLAIMILSFLTAFIISNAYYQYSLKEQNDARITEMATEIQSYLESNDQINMEDYLLSTSAMGFQIFTVSDDGYRTFYGSEFREKNLDEAAIQNVLSGQTYHGIREFPRETFVTGFFTNELSNTIGVPINHQGNMYALFVRPDISKLFSEVHILFGWLFVLTTVISILFVLIGTHFLLRPIIGLNEATRKVATQDYNIEHLDTSREDEIGQLSKSFLHMVDKIKDNENMIKSFISNISHDIQSPLANIKGYANVLKKHDVTALEKEYLTIIDYEVNRMSTMTDQLLLLSKLDQKRNILKREEYRLDKQLHELIHAYSWQLEQKDMMLTYDIHAVTISADAPLLYNVWDNLMRNAIKYNTEAGSIDITLEEREDIIVTFQDTGIGMELEQDSEIFEPFTRLDPSRSKHIKGSGLGLAIVKQIVELHGGCISVESQLHEGSTFIIYLPKK